MFTYEQSEWAVRTWDWFNEGRIVQPRSFCQFWRTVLLWATLKRLFSPFVRLRAMFPSFTMPRVPVAGLLGLPLLVAVKGCWRLVRLALSGLWLSSHPARLVLRPVGRVALAGAVRSGERVERFGQQHKIAVQRFGVGVLILFYGSLLTFWLVLALLASWFWTLIGAAAIVVGSFALYGFIKSGALGLGWQAMVVTHHAICPPVTIVRATLKVE